MEGNRVMINTVSYGWLSNNRIYYCKLHDVSRESVDELARQSIRVTREWDSAKPRLMLYDFSDERVRLTPYIAARSKDITDVIGGLAGRTAFLLAPTFESQFLAHFLMRIVRYRMRNVVMRIFYDRQQALDWLEELL